MREGELALEAVEEVLLVERLGQPVAQRRLVHLLLEDLVEVVVVGELEDGGRADLDLVAVAQLAGDRPCTPLTKVPLVEPRSCRMMWPPSIDDLGVLARDAVVDRRICAFWPRPMTDLVALDLVHLADARAGQHDQVGAVPFAARRCHGVANIWVCSSAAIWRHATTTLRRDVGTLTLGDETELGRGRRDDRRARRAARPPRTLRRPALPAGRAPRLRVRRAPGR